MTQPQTEMVELKACPFAATMHHEVRVERDTYGARVKCVSCAASGPYSVDRGAAIAAWNARTIAPDIEELVGALTDIRNRVLCPVGPAPTIDDLEAIASAALSKFTNTKGNDRG